MPCFISRLLHVGIKTLFFLLLTASAQQFDTAPTLDIQDTAIQLSTKPLNPDPDVLPDAQATIQPQIPDLLTQFQYPDDEAFTPPIISLSAPDTQTAKPNSQLSSGFCPISANLKPGASRLLRRGYGEFKPCCDPVNLGLEGPFGWIFGRTTVEDRFPYCCEGGGIEYAATRMCVPWDKAHQWCNDPDNWSCCIYGGPIFNGKVNARHCWSIYPVPLPQPAQHQH